MAETKALKPFVVKRSLWYRGQGHESSRLLRSDGQMCCLGQWGRSLGLANGEMESHPSFVFCSQGIRAMQEIAPLLMIRGHEDFERDSDLATRIINTNDSEELTEEERERRLVPLFAELGYLVTFED